MEIQRMTQRAHPKPAPDPTEVRKISCPKVSSSKAPRTRRILSSPAIELRQPSRPFKGCTLFNAVSVGCLSPFCSTELADHTSAKVDSIFNACRDLERRLLNNESLASGIEIYFAGQGPAHIQSDQTPEGRCHAWPIQKSYR